LSERGEEAVVGAGHVNEHVGDELGLDEQVRLHDEGEGRGVGHGGGAVPAIEVTVGAGGGSDSVGLTNVREPLLVGTASPEMKDVP